MDTSSIDNINISQINAVKINLKTYAINVIKIFMCVKLCLPGLKLVLRILVTSSNVKINISQINAKLLKY